MLNICTFVALLFIGTASACVDFSPHPNGDCSAFIRCVGSREIIMTCGPGTAFNPSFRGCDYPENVLCSKTQEPTTPQTEYPDFITSGPDSTDSSVISSPNSTEPPVTSGPDTSESSVTSGPDSTEPPVTPGPDTSESSVTSGPDSTEPPVTPGPDTSESSVTSGPDSTEPPVTSGPNTNESSVTSGPASTESSVSFIPDSTEPYVTLNPDTSEPSVTLGPDSTDPSVTSGLISSESSVTSDSDSTTASVIPDSGLSTPAATTPKDKTKTKYPPCPKYAVQAGKYPDIASGCKSYFKCYLGEVTVHQCPDGLIFDTWTHACNLPINAFCGFLPL